MLRVRDWLAKDGKGTGLLTHSLHAIFVVTPDIAVIKPFRSEISRVQRLACADVIAKGFDQAA